ncbi:DEAD/DEAH box helicase [Nonomuraea sp. bgisy101]|uniref:DEAD/DEAH box helicase n=1 Tax=Nonomuraea sp. bgisy101 TaxID=3413784 RepID=UPI003D721241
MIGPTPHTRKLLALLGDSELSRADLLSRARVKFPRQPDSRLSLLIDEAVTAGHITDDAGILCRVGSVPAPAPRARGLDAPPPRPLRAVAIDVESVVRTTDREPYTEKRIFQIGAVRCGADQVWASGTGRFTRWLALPLGEDWTIASARMRARHAAEAISPAEALTDLFAFLEGADAVVAYNGTDADFPMLADALAREGMPDLPGHRIDGYYLALSMWPMARSHRLATLAEDLGIETDGLSWHDATDDAELLGRLLEFGARTLASWPEGLADLVAGTCPDSTAWQLLREMAGGASAYGSKRPTTHAEIAQLTVDLLDGRAPMRNQGGGQGRSTLTAAQHLRGPDGRVDPVALAALVHGEHVRRRPAQEQMAAVLHSWTDAGACGAIEAPTGTGKSYAILAAVIDWLAAHPAHTAIVTTYTKQLQAQLADDLIRLEQAVPGLLGLSDVVKGKANRLSLRALLLALADATALESERRPRPSTAGRFLPNPRYRELLIYLFLRLRAAREPFSSWVARSVDPVDVPMFFAEYAGAAISVWLTSLSQGDAGDYAEDPDNPISLHTNTVREALAARRLVLANHALLLAHLDHLETLGTSTVLVVDEAHELENAATSALTTVLDYQALEDLHAELESWTQEASAGPLRAAVQEAVANLTNLLDHESLPKLASQLFDARSPGASVGSRGITLASPFDGSAGRNRIGTLVGLLKRLAGLCEAVTGTLRAYSAGQPLGFYTQERVSALVSRTMAQGSAAQALVADLEDFLDGAEQAPATDGRFADSEPEESTALSDPDDGDLVDADDLSDLPGLSAEGEQREDLHDRAERAGEEGRIGSCSSRGALPPNTSNRVVHARELGALRGMLRAYRFQLATSPVELPEDPDWRRFLGAFRRTYYISATLRVEGSWAFLRSRLGLVEATRTLHLPSPFDLEDQMELVCLEDFPSWAEQAEGAIRTVAHQLRGYAAAMVRPADGERGGYDNGALVLTTARSTSGGIADRLVAELRHAGEPAPVRSALVRGNRQGLAEFTDREYGGGFLIGTKGLWQGVDIADAQRLRLVWINKLPFAPFGDPVIEARRAAEAIRAESLGLEDPERAAIERYYLPMAALQLRQAVGRLIRSERHRGVVIISDRKLAGVSALRRTYRKIFLGSLEPEILKPHPVTWEPGGGNVVPMTDAWRRIWHFFARHELLDPGRASELSTDEALDEHTTLPQTRAIRELELSREEVERLRSSGGLADEVVQRAAAVAGLLRLQDGSAVLKPAQEQAIRSVADGKDLLGLLPTGFGKSYCFQLPALILPGVTLVVSPLVALMHDQALELNRSIGGAVRALVAPMRESNSRAGRTEVHEQLQGRRDHRIKIIYVSPERLCQSRFRELVRDAVRDGIITRVAVDEAHTSIQWGDDFRPSFRRVERLLAELRTEHRLRVTALTATANHHVRAGLRERIFGLREGEADSGLVTVQESPIRPELAIHRRSIASAGPAKVAALLEGVVRTIDGHAIFYCLTIKEVLAVHAHLRDHVGDGRVLVRRFHGRLTEAEKAAVMTEFREAPRQGEEGFVPLLVVATSAFGLGIDRPDVRTVFCVSPPTDLAALYQQIGRAGRDGGAPGTVNAGLALATNRGLRTVQFMTDRNLSASLARRMAVMVFGRHDGVLDIAATADQLIGEDLDAGRIDAAKARESRTQDEYAEGMARVFATLADLGAVEDLGDFPPRVAVGAGELLDPGGIPDALEEKLIATVLSLPAREGSLHRSALFLPDLDRHLAAEIDGYATMIEHPAELWALLSDLHDRGRLDVSAAPSRRFVTGVRVVRRALPGGFHAALESRTERAAAELERLRDFFQDHGACSNRKFADYFGVGELPEDCCSSLSNRCSACWDRRLDVPMGESKPAVVMALNAATRNLTASGGTSAPQERTLDRQVTALLWHVARGLTAQHLRLALRGEDSWFHAGQRRRLRLQRTITTSRYFGAAPRVTVRQVEDSLARLEAAGTVVFVEGRWREAGNVRREAARRAKENL